MRKRMTLAAILMVFSLMMVGIPEALQAAAKEPIVLQWIAGREGTVGYAVGASFAMLLQEEIPQVFKKVDLRPLGSLAGAKRIEKGDSQVCYTNAMGMYQQYNNLAYWKKHPTPPKRRMLQGIWSYALTDFTAVPVKLADSIRGYDDLADKRVFVGSPGATHFLACKAVFDVLGLFDKFKYADLPYGEVGGAVAAGRVQAAIVYHTSPAIAPPSWVTEMLSRQKMVLLNLTDQQVAKLRTGLAGTGMVPVETEIPPYMGSEKKGNVRGWEFYWGWAISPDLPEEYGYAIAKTIVEQSHKKGAATRHVEAFAKQPLKVMTTGIDTIPKIPVHPGVARYLKEKGVWKDSWVIGQLTK